MNIIADYDLEHLVVLAGDHVYMMGYEPMLRQHVEAAAAPPPKLIVTHKGRWTQNSVCGIWEG